MFRRVFPAILLAVAFMTVPAYAASYYRLGLEAPLLLNSPDDTASGSNPGGGAQQPDPEPSAVLLEVSSSVGRLGVPFSWSPTAVGLNGRGTWSVLSGALPSWASLNTNTGSITGVPTGAPTSVSGLRLRVTLAGGNVDSAAFSISTSNAFLVAAPNMTFRAGQPVTGQVEVSGASLPEISKTDGPSWLGIDALGSVTGASATVADWPYSVRADDVDGSYGIASGVVTLLSPLSFSQSPGALSAPRNTPVTTPFAVSGSPVDPIYRIIRETGTGAVPSWLTVSGNAVRAAPSSSDAFGPAGTFRVALKDRYQVAETLSAPFAVSVAEALAFTSGYITTNSFYKYSWGWGYIGATTSALTTTQLSCLSSGQNNCMLAVSRTDSQRRSISVSSSSTSTVKSYTLFLQTTLPLTVVFYDGVGSVQYAIAAGTTAKTFTINAPYRNIQIYSPDTNGTFYLKGVSAVY